MAQLLTMFYVSLYHSLIVGSLSCEGEKALSKKRVTNSIGDWKPILYASAFFSLVSSFVLAKYKSAGLQVREDAIRGSVWILSFRAE